MSIKFEAQKQVTDAYRDGWERIWGELWQEDPRDNPRIRPEDLPAYANGCPILSDTNE